MEDTFGTLVWVVAGVSAIVALYTLVGTGGSYREIGGSGIVRDADERAEGEAPDSADAERDAEIRQLLEARNARRVRRGEAPQDTDSELAALARPTVDPALREEIRDHVVARNARRERSGDAPLDVEREIERRIRELS